MPAATIDHLEGLLREKKLDGTLPRALAPSADRVAPTGRGNLDAALGGGLPRGELSEIVGAASSGRSTLLMDALAAATADRGEAAALVDPSDAFDPASAAARGVELSRLLWVRSSVGRSAADATRAVKAYSLVLQAGGFGLVVLDLSDVVPSTLRQLPWTTWMRIARVIEAGETVALLVGADRIARSARGATILLEQTQARWQGSAARARLFNGLDLMPRVARGR